MKKNEKKDDISDIILIFAQKNDNKAYYCIQPLNKYKSMKVLILQASPRANGNTAWMAEEYKKAAEAADGATAEFRDICNYWKAENMGAVTAKIDEQKTEATKQQVIELAKKL